MKYKIISTDGQINESYDLDKLARKAFYRYAASVRTPNEAGKVFLELHCAGSLRWKFDLTDDVKDFYRWKKRHDVHDNLNLAPKFISAPDLMAKYNFSRSKLNYLTLGYHDVKPNARQPLFTPGIDAVWIDGVRFLDEIVYLNKELIK